MIFHAFWLRRWDLHFHGGNTQISGHCSKSVCIPRGFISISQPCCSLSSFICFPQQGFPLALSQNWNRDASHSVCLSLYLRVLLRVLKNFATLCCMVPFPSVQNLIFSTLTMSFEVLEYRQCFFLWLLSDNFFSIFLSYYFCLLFCSLQGRKIA